jgi:hypothetical protein
VNTDKASAEFKNGVLTLTLPKVEEVKPKSIKIKANFGIEPRSNGGRPLPDFVPHIYFMQ